MSGFILNDKHYETGDLRQLQIRDQVRLERWLARSDLTDARSYEDVIQIASELAQLPDSKMQRAHPDFKVYVMIGIWVAMLQAGEDAKLDDCGRFGWGDLVWVLDAEDEEQGKGLAAS